LSFNREHAHGRFDGTHLDVEPQQRQENKGREILSSYLIGRDRTQTQPRRGRLNVLASAWHTDAGLGRPIEVLTDMSKSRKLGFLEYQATDDSFFDLFSRLREEHLIP
jgi:hypothetical protein